MKYQKYPKPMAILLENVLSRQRRPMNQAEIISELNRSYPDVVFVRTTVRAVLDLLVKNGIARKSSMMYATYFTAVR